MNKEQYEVIEDVKETINQAFALLVVVENSLVGTDGSPDPATLAEAVAGIERILQNAGAELDQLTNE